MATNSKAATTIQRLEDDTEKQLEMQLLNAEKSAGNVPGKKKMPSKKKKITADMLAGGGDSSMFGVTLKQLETLMNLRGQDLAKQLNEPELNGINGLLEKLKVDGKKGLDSKDEKDFEERRIAFGYNEIPQKPLTSFLGICWRGLRDPILLLLLACAVISIGLSLYEPPKREGEVHEENTYEWIEGVAILIAVIVVVLVGALNDWRKDRQFRNLQNKMEKDNNISVVRDNVIQQVPVVDLVVGDICFIKYGDILPADGLVVQSSDLKIDESSLTGETNLIKKNEIDNIGVTSGTQVMEGSARILITAVGLNSQIGIIMSLLGETGVSKKSKKKNKKDAKKKNEAAKRENDDKNANGDKAVKSASPAENEGDADEVSDKKNTSVLQPKLSRITLYAGYMGIIGAVLTLLFLVIRYSITNYWINGQKISAHDGSYYISFIIQAISVFVVCVPEGLPLAVTLALTYAVQKMMTDHNFVRHLYACETMANATTICSDKTGTLTTNRMTVVQSYIKEKHYESLPPSDQLNSDYLSLLFESISVNTNSTSKIEEAKDGGLPKQIGNKTECALLDFVLKLGGSYDAVRQEFPQEKIPKVYTFNSARKMMSTIVKRNDGYRVYTKGASEMVLTKCTSMIGQDGEVKPLTEEDKANITSKVIEKMAGEALRTICIAYKNLGSDEQDWENDDAIVDQLTFIAIVGIEDPVRDEVPDAIVKCQRAGVVVRMVTGDNLMTARSIAAKCGIVKPGEDFLILESKEFNQRIRDESGKVSQKLLDEVWPKLRVLARSSPQDKYILVNGIVESNITSGREVVAVTGDGTNDAPALKRADVGFAMGIQGTEVAKRASDIVLTNDNFSSIIQAIIWGRNVYDCIAKFIQFQLTANLTALVISIVSAAAISIVPLKAVQMLWVNLVMDTLASLALATEPPTDSLLNRKPYGRTKLIISSVMFRNIVGQSVYQLLVMFTIIYAGQHFLGVESTVQKIQHDPHAARELSAQLTLVFNAFVLMTLFNEINARKLHGERNVFKGLFNNPLFCLIWFFCFGSQILIVTFGGYVSRCQRLTLYQWGWSLLFGAGSLIWQQIILCIPVKRSSSRQTITGAQTGKTDGQEDSDAVQRRNTNEPIRYSTISQLAGATVVAEPPPAFTRFMLRKSVDRLNNEFRTINEFRSRLEEIQDKCEEVNEIKRSSRADILDV